MYQKLATLKNCIKKGKIGKTKTLSQAIRTWENENKTKIQDQETVRLAGEVPPIGKLDARGIKKLSYVKELSISTNEIKKLPDLGRMMRLETLHAGRNDLETLGHINLATSLKHLYLSYNNIETLDAFESLKNLRILSLAYNKIEAWAEIEKLKPLSKLRKLTLVGNPLYETEVQKSKREYRVSVICYLPQIRVLDGKHSKTHQKLKSFGSYKSLTSLAETRVSSTRRASNPQIQLIDDETSDISISGISNESKSPKLKRPKSMMLSTESTTTSTRASKNFKNLTVNTSRVDPHNPHQRYYAPKSSSDLPSETMQTLKRHMSQYRMSRRQKELAKITVPLPHQSIVQSVPPVVQSGRELMEEAGKQAVCAELNKCDVEQPETNQIIFEIPKAHD
mmetsp:Transcript_6311/g.9181  ORF Transcript_6311/g.9181 Transcript_6311/m.9181 type:complete len:394 (+) Transcript_6311:46-1227(+)